MMLLLNIELAIPLLALVGLGRAKFDINRSQPVSKFLARSTTCQASGVQRRRRDADMCSCRRRHGSFDLATGWTCRNNAIVVDDTPVHHSYVNVTLGTTEFNATVFLPSNSLEALAYYTSTRFDWSSMIGDVQIGGHTFFPSSFWQQPHDPNWPESGVGLASEFGCGDDGSHCNAGWGAYEAGASNGVLGYDEADNGEPFLKIGVGKLVKGSCTPGVQRCKEGDATYRFNSPYQFAEAPVWNVTRVTSDSVEMVHEATLGNQWGYRLYKSITVCCGTVVVKTELENIGQQAFRTPHYSHNFLSADNLAIGPGWAVSLDLNVTSYEDSSWATPLDHFFDPNAALNVITATKEVPESTAIKANFIGVDAINQSKGEYQASFGGITLKHTFQGATPPLFAYNLYIERTTLSPEPILMIDLAPGESKAWYNVLHFTQEA